MNTAITAIVLAAALYTSITVTVQVLGHLTRLAIKQTGSFNVTRIVALASILWGLFYYLRSM